MKTIIKIFICISIILIGLNSCVKYNKEYNLTNCEKNHLIISSEDNSYLNISIYKINYEGHDYILFNKYKEVSVVHNPDCKYCKKDTINN